MSSGNIFTSVNNTYVDNLSVIGCHQNNQVWMLLLKYRAVSQFYGTWPSGFLWHCTFHRVQLQIVTSSACLGAEIPRQIATIIDQYLPVVPHYSPHLPRRLVFFFFFFKFLLFCGSCLLVIVHLRVDQTAWKFHAGNISLEDSGRKKRA